MSEPFIGEVRSFGFNFAPRGWAKCEGQLLAISNNTALFSLLGTTYGGDGRTTFALPDFRGRAPVHEGTGPGLPTIRLGQRVGLASKILVESELPTHSHNFGIDCSTAGGDGDDPSGSVPAQTSTDNYSSSTDAKMAGMTTSSAGNGQAFDVQGPRLGTNMCIALTGLFPSRS